MNEIDKNYKKTFEDIKHIDEDQTYFAVQTRKQEISEKEYSMLTEDEKRFYQRNLVSFYVSFLKV